MHTTNSSFVASYIYCFSPPLLTFVGTGIGVKRSLCSISFIGPVSFPASIHVLVQWLSACTIMKAVAPSF